MLSSQFCELTLGLTHACIITHFAESLHLLVEVLHFRLQQLHFNGVDLSSYHHRHEEEFNAQRDTGYGEP